MIKKISLFILSFFFLVSPLSAQKSKKWIIGGPVRAGYFKLTEYAQKEIETSVQYDENRLDNNIGKSMFLDYVLGYFRLGVRWMAYELKASDETLQIEQVLQMDYLFYCMTLTFLEGDFIHPKLDSRLGITVGQGENRYRLSTKTIESLATVTVDETFSTRGEAKYAELFFGAALNNGWGYRFGYFVIETFHDSSFNGNKAEGSAQPSFNLSIIWQY